MIKLDITNINSGKLSSVNLDEAIKSEFLIGRAPNSDVQLDDPYVSRFHAKILIQNGKFFISDQASSGGTKVNEVSLSPLLPYNLEPGAVIKLGSYIINFSLLTDSRQSTSTTATGEITAPNLKASAKSDKWKDLEVECVRVVEETHDVKTFYFRAPDRVFHYKPGQFVTLNLPIGGKEVLRSYSISSSPSRPETLEITIKRVPAPADSPDAPPGLVSNWMHDHVKVGTKLTLSGPLGKFTCADQSLKKLLFISAGSGITPMMSMSRWILDLALDYDIVFFHAARSVEDIIYRHELEWMSSRYENFKLFITTTRNNLGHPWFGLRGRLNREMMTVIAPDLHDRAVYVCGPNEFMSSTKTMLEEAGYPMVNYHEESFGGAKKKTSSAPPVAHKATEIAPASPGGLKANLLNIKPASSPAPELVISSSATQSLDTKTIVVFQKTGKTITCSNDDIILEIAEQAGVKIRSSCRVGTCGTCKKRKLAGEVRLDDHDPEALEPDEIAEGYILTCVAHPVGEVVIDA